MQWLIGLVTGPFFGLLLKAYTAKLTANNTSENIAQQVAIRALELDQREAEMNAKVVIAEQGNWVTRSVRPLMAMPFILFLWKVVVWDKVLGWGTTDPLDPKMWGVFMAVVVAYMGGRSAERVADKIAESVKAIRR